MAITTINSLAIPAGTVVSADLTYPLTGFSSTGIDDNATSTAITIDASENVGIGGSPVSSTRRLMVTDTGDVRVDIRSGSDTNLGAVDFSDTSNTARGQIIYDHSDDSLQVRTLSTERMRIDSRGNVGIGETSPTRGLHVKDAAQTIARFESTSTSRGVISILDANTTDDTSVGIGAVANDLVLYSGNLTEGIRLNSSGNVGIGTASPQFQLHLSGSAPGVVMSETGAVKYYRNRAAASALTWDILNTDYSYNSEAMRIDSSGNLLVGKTSLSDTTVGFQVEPSGRTTSTMASSTSGTSSFNLYSTGAGAYRFYVSLDGQVRATNTSILAISDASLKENVRDLDKGLDTINALQPRRFDWKNGDGNDIMGFIAQEVEEVMPELVHDYKYTDEENKKGLKMGDMVPSMVKAIQELSAQVTELKAEVAALKGA